MLGEPKVGHLDVTICAEQKVFWLEIPVNDVEGMQVVDGQSYLGSVELCYRIGKSLTRSKMDRTSVELIVEPTGPG